MPTAILWFRRDLRLSDNPALAAAARTHESLLPVFIDDPQGEGAGAGGEASRWWLHHALQDVKERLREKGSDLLLFRGISLEILDRIQRQTRAEAIYWNRVYEPAMTERDRKIKAFFKSRGLAVRSFKANVLSEPWEARTAKQQPFRVFTPYRNHLLRQGLDNQRAQVLGRWPKLPRKQPESAQLNDLELRPTIAWDTGLQDTWDPTEKGAKQHLKRFKETRLEAYHEGRDSPARDGISRLSPYLRFGQIAPQRCVDAAAPLEGMDGPWIRQLLWREFAYHVLYHFPHTVDRPMDLRFQTFPWEKPDTDILERWRHGHTGIPLVDAGMRELWTTGWMHNRVRMVVASFLTKHLLIHWREGAAWFMDTLVDADLANNTMGWQWTAGSGADAAPFFRVFNPVLQGEKFDSHGEYIRRWVPKLASAPDWWIHKPWEAPSTPKDYPSPMIDLKIGRARALEAFARIKGDVTQ